MGQESACLHFSQQLSRLGIDNRLHRIQIIESFLYALVFMELEALLIEREGLLRTSHVIDRHDVGVHLMAVRTCCADEDMILATIDRWIKIVLHLCSDGARLVGQDGHVQCLRLRHAESKALPPVQ